MPLYRTKTKPRSLVVRQKLHRIECGPHNVEVDKTYVRTETARKHYQSLISVNSVNILLNRKQYAIDHLSRNFYLLNGDLERS